jgi:type II secretory pathway pseudopilin PulG
MRPNARDGGFTIVEVLVAVLVLVMAATATFGVLSAATKNTQRAKATQVALDRAQQEVEALRGLKNEQLAMTATPGYSSDPLNPDHRVSNSEFALTREPPGGYATMVVNGGSIYGGGEVKGGVVSPDPIPFTSGDVSGKVYRYGVWRNDEKCPEEKCPGKQDFKQIVVAVKLNTPGNQSGERGYVEVQSDFVNPTKSPRENPVPGEHGVVTAQQFFLTDTPCAATGTTQRQPITGNHPLHNTLGTCASGLQNGETHGAPDALLLGGPPVPEEGSVSPPLYDYSSDLVFNPETDRGVQLIREKNTSGCPFYKWPEGTTNQASKVHLWVTDPMAADFTMTGRVTIEFYTRTLDNSEKTKGTLCVYLYKRHEEGSPPVATDSRLANTSGGTLYWEYTPEHNGWWPSLKWEKARMTMNFSGAPYTIHAGERLGVAISVESKNTEADALPIVYDHPSYPTRIEVDTNTPIEGG